MKLEKVLLRWYKSFHLNYRQIFERGEVESYRPWNTLTPSYAGDSAFPFIEIPIQPDITTIVGANESGKSHLLNAINKVIRGRGINDNTEFSRTDLCHYAGIRQINVEAWPNIGLLFSVDNSNELSNVAKAANIDAKFDDAKCKSFAIVLAPEDDSPGVLFIEPNTEPYRLTEKTLESIRSLLPSVQYIDSRALLPSELTLASLIQGYDAGFPHRGLKERKSVENAAGVIAGLSPPNAKDIDEYASELSNAQQTIEKLHEKAPLPNALEMLLFKQIIEVESDTLKYIYSLDGSNRGYIEGQIAKWNEKLNDELNLSHFWHQDEQFRLSLNYKDGVIYFEIHDKTECIYTFEERSSGLKFFLSYYIQAKALEMSGRSKNSIILMDEPDAALSILAQRNLLSVFESLVRPETSHQVCQLVYTTHSPYLINRNFPRRISVVKKEDAEEGTQYIEHARARRYEPVRTALGIDSAPSLFLGADNIVLEGTTDQYIITELIRAFATPDDVGEYLDLNSVVIVSAEGVSNVTNIVEQSTWADEPIPPTAILLDSDGAAEKEIDRITRPDKPSKGLVPIGRISKIADLIKPFGENSSIITSEDIIPVNIYKRAIENYVKRWLPTIHGERKTEIDGLLKEFDTNKKGIAGVTKELFSKIQPELSGDFDKMGIFQQVIEIIHDKKHSPNSDENLTIVKQNVKSICRFFAEALAEARESTKRYSATQSIKRLIKDFQRLNRDRVPVSNIQKLIKRLENEIEPIGADSDDLASILRHYFAELEDLRVKGQVRLVENEWRKWEQRIDAIKKNPLKLQRVKENIADNTKTDSDSQQEASE